MSVTVKFDPTVNSKQAQIIPDASLTNDGVMTKEQVALLLAGGGGGGDFKAVASIAERDALTPVLGMVVTVTGDTPAFRTYQLAAVSPSVWVIYRPMTDSSAIVKTIEVNGSTGNDTTGNGTLGAPYATRQRAEQDIPTFLGGSQYTIHLVNYSETTTPNPIEFPAYQGTGRVTYAADLTPVDTILAGEITSIVVDPITGINTIHTTHPLVGVDGFFVQDQHGQTFAMAKVQNTGPDYYFEVGSTSFFGYAPTPGDNLTVLNATCVFDGPINWQGTVGPVLCTGIQFQGVSAGGSNMTIPAGSFLRFGACRFVDQIDWIGGQTLQSFFEIPVSVCVFDNAGGTWLNLYEQQPVIFGSTFINNFRLRGASGSQPVAEVATTLACVVNGGISIQPNSVTSLFLTSVSQHASIDGGELFLSQVTSQGLTCEITGGGKVSASGTDISNTAGILFEAKDGSTVVLDSVSGAANTGTTVQLTGGAKCYIETPASITITNVTDLVVGGLAARTWANYIASFPIKNQYDVTGDDSQCISPGYDNVGIDAVIVTAALTGGGTQGSMTFEGGVLVAQVAAT